MMQAAVVFRRAVSTTLTGAALAAPLWTIAVAAPIVVTGALAAPSYAQDSGKDTVALKDGTTQTGKIKAEEYGGLILTVKEDKTIAWNDIVAGPAGVTYAGSPAFQSVREKFDSGKYEEALEPITELAKDTKLRAPLRQHVLYFKAIAEMRTGKLDEAITSFKDLLTAFPKSRYLLDVGDNLVQIYIAKKDMASAAKALDQISSDAATAGVESGFSAAINVLKGRLLEEQQKFPEAQAAYTVAEKGTGVAPSVVAQAILGQARCAIALKDNVKAEGLFRKIVNGDGPNNVMAGAWNGIGDLLYADATPKTGKADAAKINDALYCYLRGVVQYSPLPGEAADEYERALAGAVRCFKGLAQLETKADLKAAHNARANERYNQLLREFPNTKYKN